MRAKENEIREQDPGKLLLLPDFPSRFIPSRNLAIWLPPGYGEQSDQRYRVIYAHDGQNLFDPATSFAGVDWGLQWTLSRLIAEGSVAGTLVVGIWNTPQRYREYDPEKVFERYLSPKEKTDYIREFGRPLADRYLQFIVQELKPFVDSRYRTLPDAADTFLLGSSMGAMISLYALCEYPGIFGGSACLSTHWPAIQGKMVTDLADRLPDPQSHRLYFDYGTEGVDAQYELFQLQVDAVIRQNGYVEGTNWITRKFPGEDHSERAWRRRVEIPLRFLLK